MRKSNFWSIFVIICLLCFYFVFQPMIAQAGSLKVPGFNPAPATIQPQAQKLTIPAIKGAAVTPPSPAELPALKTGGLLEGIDKIDDTTTPNKLVIQQNQEKAIIDWSSFNIGADATVQFDQQGNTKWTVLNRIYSLDPSLIFGKLMADGKIYLVNQNGILFGSGSQVNVNTLVASALNIRNDDFIKGSLKFYIEDGKTTDDVDLSGKPYSYSGITFNADAMVSNIGTINTAKGGSVFLIGPRVENYGSIDAPIGQIGLAAGTLVDMIVPYVDPIVTGYQRTAFIVNVKDGFGEAVNSGQLTADMGMAGMYGGVVNQDGLIRAVTAINQKGRIELIAKDSISTGSQSKTETPISTSSDKTNTSTSSFGGEISMHGNFEKPDDAKSVPAGIIELNGTINAPSGMVTLNANDRVFLETGSSINAGGAWSDESASALAIQVQLNSVELADAYGQKDGILKGQKITANILKGSSIGNINNAILNRKKTALEHALRGGTIDINCTGGNSDIIIKDGATLDFSGGGINYSGGLVYTTRLLSGGKSYDISNAPLNLAYDKILGGLGTYVAAHTEGGDAGSLSLAAGTIVLDGQLKGSATRGIYQNAWNTVSSASGSFYPLSVARGLEVPRGGTLIIGKNPREIDFGLEDVSVKEITVSKNISRLDAGFGPADTLESTDALSSNVTVIPASTVNAAGLSNLSLYADTAITTESGAQINLLPGGNFKAYARRIEHNGSVSVPAGTIDLIISDFLLPAENLTGKIFLDSGSSLDVAGQMIDNTLTGKKPTLSRGTLTEKTATQFPGSGQTGGGSINIYDKTDNGQGIFIPSGALVDVGGGYIIDSKGNITGGNAGNVNIQGSNIMLGGDLRGYALADAGGKIKGGSITINSTNISVEDTAPAWPVNFTADSNVGPDMADKFVLEGNRFDDTGFTQITLNSLNDIEINTTITTSLVRLNYPSSSALPIRNALSGKSQVMAGRPDLIRLDDSIAFMAGSSSFSAAAGKVFLGANSLAVDNLTSAINYTEKTTVLPGALVNTAPGGTINLSAPALVDMAGTIQSPGGKINIRTTGNLAGVGDVQISGRILAYGYNRPDAATTVSGFAVNQNPQSGGTVNLAAPGDIIMAQGSLIDISGSEPVENVLKSSDGKIIKYSDAGNPGSLSLNFSGDLKWDGDVQAKPQMAGISGGALTVGNTGGLLDISAGDIKNYLTAGFDDVTLKSNNVLQFGGAINETIGRKLTLDAPQIAGFGGKTVFLQAPWITLANTSNNAADGLPVSGSGHFTLASAGWLDLNGSINISGFQDMNLEALRDIRLTDKYYDGNIWEGKLSVAGDLIMKADRIYPTTNSTYHLYSTGKSAILPADNPVGGSIFSAGGNLTAGALGGIEIKGVLAAPMGTITLQNYLDDPAASEGGRIYLADNSIVTTAGDAAVKYGELDVVSSNWTITNKSDKSQTVEKAPQKAVTIHAAAGEAIVMSKAKIDTSGGGSIFAYNWQRGIEGSVNPLTKTGRYVVVSDNSVQLPGATVYLTGGGGLAAGTYSLLPVDYAFLPGAYVIELQSGTVIPMKGAVTKEGYPLSAGYASVADTNIRSTKPQIYSVRPAAKVLAEGHFEKATIVAGDAGDVTVKGDTVIVDGILQAAALTGYEGGQVSLSATNIIVKQATPTVENILPADFSFDASITSFNPDLQGKLTISADRLSGKGFRKVNLGGDDANSIEIEAGAVLDAGNISLAANKTVTKTVTTTDPLTEETTEETTTIDPSISIQAGAKLGVENASGLSGTDEITLATTGALNIADAVLHAKNNITLDVNDVPGILGKLQVDNSSITLKSSNIYFGGEKAQTDIGLLLTTDIWNRFTGYQDITLVGRNDIQFRDSFSISSARSLTLDAQRIAGMMKADGAVTVAAPIINLQNSGIASTAAALSTNAGQVSFNGDNINAGKGDVLFGGFSNIALNGKGDVTFKGVGSLTTGGADLQISASRITTGSGLKSDETYQAANFRVVAGVGKNDSNPANKIMLTNSGVAPGATSTPGGTLEFWGKSIENGTLNEDGTVNKGTIVQVDGGDIKLVAKGIDPVSDGVFLRDGARILAKGTDAAPGGRVTLQTASGKISLDTGSEINVDAGTQGDAGAVTLLAPTGGVTIGGTLSGQASGGAGSSFILDTHELVDTDMSNLIGTLGMLASGGFTQSIDLRSRIGNIDIADGQALTAKHVKLTADDQSAGQINVSGTIDASSYAGGTVELYAMNDLSIDGKIKGGAPSNVNSNGWPVLLSSAQGSVNVNNGGAVDGGGGIIYLRAQRNGNDVKINLNGSLTGASAVYAEAFIPHTASSFSSSWLTEAKNYYNANTAVGRLEGSAPGGAANFHLLPGIEWTSTGNITIASLVNLSPSIPNTRYQTQHDIDIGKAAEPGVLTVRAAGDLNINNNLVDRPTADRNSLSPSDARDSWAFNLTAGADMTSADYLAVNSNSTGNLTIAEQKLVYTESAPIRFASGGDTVIGRGQDSPPGYMINSFMTYNLASYDGSIEGMVGRDLQINGGAIQTATGDIDITIGGNLNLTNKTVRGKDALGAIRTTGWFGSLPSPSPTNPQHWTYTSGGDIYLNIGGNIGKKTGEGQWTTALMNSQWDYTDSSGLKWSANYGSPSPIANPSAGLATMGGGDLVVRTGGDFLTQAGTFGQNDQGDLIIYAGGDIRGRFLNTKGRAEIHAMGNFGAVNEPQVIEAFDSQINITTQGDINLATVINPSITAILTKYASQGYYQLESVNIGYSENASLNLTAGGDVTLGYNDPFHNPWNIHAEEILPPTLNIEAGGDILVKHDFALLPSPTGNLSLIAGGSINGQYFDTGDVNAKRAQIFVSDMDPADIYNGVAVPAAVDKLFLRSPHAASPIHAEDTAPVVISAGQDIENLKLFLPKKAQIIAVKGDIRDVFYYGQNIHADMLDAQGHIITPGDVSQIVARQGNIFFGSNLTDIDTGFVQAGPGSLFVQAGGSINMGNAVQGIQTAGNYFNPVLGTKGSSLIILSGYNKYITSADVETFFGKLRDEIKSGDSFDVSSQKTREEIIPLLGLGSPSGSGDINMTTSQISTNSGKDNIYIIANGKVDVGKSTFFSNEAERAKTGIFTAGGGAINIFANGDVNVNESRVMTFEGGDITVWSDSGDINAGRGAKEEVIASPPHASPIYDDNQNIIGYSVKFDPPAVGSGIRAVTFDPDGAAGPLSAPPAGDIYPHARIIDAGEAGIAGGNIYLQAQQVLNVGNISSIGSVVGMPVAAATTGIGTLSGSGSATQNSQMLSSASGLGTAGAANASQMIDNIMTKWLDVKVIDFIINDSDDNDKYKKCILNGGTEEDCANK